MTKPHSIRIHGPWRASIDGGPEVKFKLPDAFPVWPVAGSAKPTVIVLHRKFNSPTSLSPTQQVNLAIELGSSGKDGDWNPGDLQIVVTVNGSKTTVTWQEQVEIPVREFLKPHNSLTIHLNTGPANAGIPEIRLNLVALLIHDDRATDNASGY